MAIRHLHDLSVVGNVTVATTGVTNNVLLTSTDTSAASAPDLVLYRNALIADSDTLGVLEFQGRNGMVTSSTAPLTYGAIYGRVFDASENQTGLTISANKGNGSGAFEGVANMTLIGTNNAGEGAIIINPDTDFELPNSNLEVKGSYGITTQSHGSSANWKQAYDNHITGVAVTGTSTKTITLTQRDGGTISANFSDQSGSGGINMTNGSNNRVVTAVDLDTVNGEAGLLFGGSYLEITPGNIATPLQIKRTSASTRQVNLMFSANDGTTTSEGFLGIDNGADLRYGAGANTAGNSLILTEDNTDFVVNSSTNQAIIRLAGGGTNFTNFNIGGEGGAVTINTGSNSLTVGLEEFIEEKYIYTSNDSNAVYMPMVKGGMYATTTSLITGQILIKIPAYKAAMMQQFYVDIYDYSTGESMTFKISGYSYDDTNATWYNTSVVNLSDDTDRDFTVRFGADTTNSFQYVAIGETNSTWNYPQINVRDFYGGYATSENDAKGSFDVSFVTTTPGSVSRTHTGNFVAGDYNNLKNTPTIPTVNNGTLTVEGTGALGGSGTFTANQSGNTTISISHDDTSSQGSIDNSNGTVIQDVTLDAYGHVTALGSVNLDGRYYTESESDSRFVNVTGDTMTGTLTSTQNGGTASIYINSTRPSLGFTDTNSFSDANDVAIIRGGSNRLQFQWYDDSAGTTTEWLGISNGGNVYFSGSSLYFDGSNTHLRSDNEFKFLYDNGNAQKGRFLGIQVGSSYSGTIPNNGILFSTDTNLYRDAANTLRTNDALIVDGVLTVDNKATVDYLELKDQNGTVESNFHIYGWDTELQFTKRNLSTGAWTGTLLSLNYSTNAATFLGDLTVGGGDIVLSGTGRIQGVDTVSASTDAANKAYVDAHTYSHNHDDRYYTETESDAKYLLNTTDTLVGNLTVTGNVTHTGLTMTSGTDIDQIYSVTKTLTLSTSWQDTGIIFNNLTTGSYILQVYVNDNSVGGNHYSEYYTGVMSWYSSGTNSTVTDEINLHRAGHAPNSGDIFLRTARVTGNSSPNLHMEIRGSTNNTGTSGYTFKFRRLI